MRTWVIPLAIVLGAIIGASVISIFFRYDLNVAFEQGRQQGLTECPK